MTWTAADSYRLAKFAMLRECGNTANAVFTFSRQNKFVAR